MERISGVALSLISFLIVISAIGFNLLEITYAWMSKDFNIALKNPIYEEIDLLDETMCKNISNNEYECEISFDRCPRLPYHARGEWENLGYRGALAVWAFLNILCPILMIGSLITLGFMWNYAICFYIH